MEILKFDEFLNSNNINNENDSINEGFLGGFISNLLTKPVDTDIEKFFTDLLQTNFQDFTIEKVDANDEKLKAKLHKSFKKLSQKMLFWVIKDLEIMIGLCKVINAYEIIIVRFENIDNPQNLSINNEKTTYIPKPSEYILHDLSDFKKYSDRIMKDMSDVINR